jgi:hypothetical protein
MSAWSTNSKHILNRNQHQEQIPKLLAQKHPGWPQIQLATFWVSFSSIIWRWTSPICRCFLAQDNRTMIVRPPGWMGMGQNLSLVFLGIQSWTDLLDLSCVLPWTLGKLWIHGSSQNNMSLEVLDWMKQTRCQHHDWLHCNFQPPWVS